MDRELLLKVISMLYPFITKYENEENTYIARLQTPCPSAESGFIFSTTEDMQDERNELYSIRLRIYGHFTEVNRFIIQLHEVDPTAANEQWSIFYERLLKLQERMRNEVRAYVDAGHCKPSLNTKHLDNNRRLLAKFFQDHYPHSMNIKVNTPSEQNTRVN